MGHSVYTHVEPLPDPIALNGIT